MARIAEGTCATCHTIRPKNEMREVAVSRRVGTRYGISHGSRRTRQSASAQYRRQFVWVCKGCRAPKSDGLIPWRFLLVLVLAAFAYLWFSGVPASRVRDAARSLPAAATGAGRTEARTERAAAADDAPASRDEGLTAGIGSEIGGDAPTADAPSFDWDQDAVRAATVDALDAGKPRRWKAGGVKGQAVPSEPTASAEEGECRNVYQTAKVEGETLTSGTATWCRADGGQWRKDD